MNIFKKQTSKKHDKNQISQPSLENSHQAELEEIHNGEKLFFNENSNTTYDFFGYLTDPDQLPIFIEEKKDYIGYFQHNLCITPFTPKILEHCVKKLTPQTMKEEASNIPLFKKKCLQLAHAYSYTPIEEWDQTIKELIHYISKPHHLSDEQLTQLVQSLTTQDLTSINWNSFGAFLQQHKGLSKSYNPSPTVKTLHKSKNGNYDISLKFEAPSIPTYTSLRIYNNKVLVHFNGETKFLTDPALFKIWKDFCGYTFEGIKTIEQPYQKQKDC